MILLVSPHNVVKKDYYVNNFKIDDVASLNKKDYSIYSQGINISSCLKTLQTEPFLLTFFGGVNGKHVKNHLHVNRIKFDMLHISRNSYEKINIIDTDNKTLTVIDDNTNKGKLICNAIIRIMNPVQVDYSGMLVLAIIGVCLNIL